MKNQRLVFFIAAVLIYTLGCSPKATKQPDSVPTVTVQAPSTKADEPILSIQIPGKLQITYAQIDDALNTEFFAIDISCFNDNDLCFGEPTSLFKISYDTDINTQKPSGLVTQYDWSLDGSKIVLSANEDLFIGDMNTQGWTNITNSPDIEEHYPKWSSDGSGIYYLSCSRELGYGFCKLARFDLAEKESMIVLNSTDKHVDVFAISPDRQIVVFNSSQFLYQSNFDGSKIRQITSSNSEENSPSFSPDGNTIAFVRRNGPTSTSASGTGIISDIILKDLRTGEEKNLTEDFEDEASSPVFSTNGKWVVFEGFGSDQTFHIYIVSLNGATIIQITRNNLDELSPAWRLSDVHQ